MGERTRWKMGTGKERRLTESSVEVVGDGPSEGLPQHGSGEGSVDGESGDDGEGESRDDLDVLRKSGEGDGRQRALLGEHLSDVVVVGVAIIYGSSFSFSITVISFI